MRKNKPTIRIWKLVLIVIVLVVGVYYIGDKINKVEYKADDICSDDKINSNYMTQEEYKDNCLSQIKSSKSELEKIMEEETFKKITILRARKVANDNKKAIEVERNKQVISAIESEYEAIRASEIEIVGKNGDVSLK